MFFRCAHSPEEKAWDIEWQAASLQAKIYWHTLFWQEESRHFHKIFETQIEEIFERISSNRDFIRLFDDDDLGDTIFMILDDYKNALLDELWSRHTSDNVRHVMNAARALERASRAATFQDAAQFTAFNDAREQFKNKIAHSTFGPTTKMVGGVLLSYYVSAAAFFSVVILCSLCPPVLGLVATIACVLPFLLGTKFSIARYKANVDSEDAGEIVATKLDSLKLG